MRARDNPFRTERLLGVRYRLQGLTWAEFMARCERLGYRGALVGPQGSGKTTLLEDLESKLQQLGFTTIFIRLDQEHPSFHRGFVDQILSQLTSSHILLFDGVEQINAFTWRWFRWRTRRAGGLFITVHKPGRMPTLWECRTSAPLLAEIATDLLGSESGELCQHAEVLFKKHSGNLREALREWYDLLARGQGGIGAAGSQVLY